VAGGAGGSAGFDQDRAARSAPLLKRARYVAGDSPNQRLQARNRLPWSSKPSRSATWRNEWRGRRRYCWASSRRVSRTGGTDLLNQLFFIASRDNVLNALKAQQNEVWYYRFDWDEEPAPWNDIYGAAHAFDLAFVFGDFGRSLFGQVANSTANRPGRLDLSDAMMKSVGAFARSGDPNNAALGVTWPAWPAKLIFDATPAVKAISVQ